MTAFKAVTINCDGSMLGLPDAGKNSMGEPACPGWHQSDAASITTARREAHGIGWSSGRREGTAWFYDLCPAHTRLKKTSMERFTS